MGTATDSATTRRASRLARGRAYTFARRRYRQRTRCKWHFEEALVLKQGTPVARSRRPHVELWAFFRGEIRAVARCAHQRHDPCLQLRDRRFRRHPRLLERGARSQLFGPRARLRTTSDLRASARLLMMEVRQSPEELAEIDGGAPSPRRLREDVYIRPIVYKSSRDDRGPAAQPGRRHRDLRRAVRPVHRHRGRDPGAGLDLAPDR